jgi:hypothetical protein
MIRRQLVVALMLACVCVTPTLARHRAIAFDANGNGAGIVVSHKTGAHARVGVQYASGFQSYIDAIEATGATVRFMGGIRRGHCWSGGMHPCGKALDVCQTGRGRVDPRCHLPSRHELARIASAHGLFEGGQWCHSDYGHAQVGESAAPCGRRHIDPATTMVASAHSHHRRGMRAYANAAAPDRLTASY